MTDANQTTTYSYDALNQLKTIEDPLTQTTQYTYDQAGNLRSLTDAKTQTTGFVYDTLGRLTQETRPMGQATTYEYNEAGTLSEKQDAKGQRTEYVYEPQTNLLTDIYYYDGAGAQTGHVIFSYDRNGNLSGYDDGTTSANYAYDDVGRKLSETVNYGPFSKTFSYTYYANGQKQSFSMPDGTTYSYTYNSNNDLQNIRIPGVGNVSYPSYTMSRPDNMTFPDGSQSDTYDTLLRLNNIDGQHLDSAYSYDTVSNILTKQTEHGSYGYDYDDLYRLTDADNPTLDDEAYSYDQVGNRLTTSGVSGTIEHNANNELEYYGDISYAYDANGNMISKSSAAETWQYVYNVQNRLVRVEDGDGLTMAEYGYDPFGRRLWKEVNSIRTYFFYADEGLVAEYDEDGQELRSYGYTPNSLWTTNPLFQKVGSKYYFYLNDLLGIPQRLIDSTGGVVWSATYTAFGKAVIHIEDISNPLRFPGQYFDGETGLHYNLQRYYEPIIGRYLRTDPLGLKGWINTYVYTANDPVNKFDLDGLEPNKAQATTLDDAIKIISKYKKLQDLRYVSGQAHGKAVGPFGGDKGPRYIYTVAGGWIDLGHFFQVAAGLEKEGCLVGWKKGAGKWVPGASSYIFSRLWEITEDTENAQQGETRWSYEDAPSNYFGGEYYIFYHQDDASMVSMLQKYFTYLGATDPSEAPNWDMMQAKPQKNRQFPENESFVPWFTSLFNQPPTNIGCCPDSN